LRLQHVTSMCLNVGVSYSLVGVLKQATRVCKLIIIIHSIIHVLRHENVTRKGRQAPYRTEAVLKDFQLLNSYTYLDSEHPP